MVSMLDFEKGILSSNPRTEFSSWEDFFVNLRTGIKLPIHTVVMEANRRLKRIECGTCTIDHVSGDISINLHEEFPPLMKGYQITA